MEARLTEIRREEALRYMGITAAPSAEMARDLDRCAETVAAAARPKAVWRLFETEEDGTLKGTNFRPEGEDVRRLTGGGPVILMAATLGAEVERLILRTEGTSMSDALMMDALASAAIENVCDNLCCDLAREMAPRRLTPRFSPGYGDFPLEQQKNMCDVLNVGRLLGITLTPGGLMIPQKSVTALIGLTETDGEKTGGCAACAMRDRCLYRREDAEDGR